MWNHPYRSMLASNGGRRFVVDHGARSIKNSRSCRHWKSSLSPILNDKESHDEHHQNDESFVEKNKNQTAAAALQKLLLAGQTSQRHFIEERHGHMVIINDVDDSKVSPSQLTYTGGVTIPVTSHMHIVTPDEDTPRGTWPIFRVMVGTIRTPGCSNARIQSWGRLLERSCI